MGFEIGGLGDIQKRFDELVQSTENKEEEELPLSELFNKNFMTQYTRFSSFDEFLEVGGFEVSSTEDIKTIPGDLLDSHIAHTTKFINWQDMKIKAEKEYAAKK